MLTPVELRTIGSCMNHHHWCQRRERYCFSLGITVRNGKTCKVANQQNDFTPHGLTHPVRQCCQYSFNCKFTCCISHYYNESGRKLHYLIVTLQKNYTLQEMLYIYIFLYFIIIMIMKNTARKFTVQSTSSRDKRFFNRRVSHIG